MIMPDDAPSPTIRRGRASSLHIPKRSDPTPIPPSLANSPYLLSPYSIFRREPATQKTPSKEHDEWLRDMVPLDWDNAPYTEKLAPRPSTAISVPKLDSETSRDDSSSPSSEISPHSLTVASPRPRFLHRPWSSPNTSSLIVIDLRFSDRPNAPDTRA